MSETSKRAVHSIVCVLPEPLAPGRAASVIQQQLAQLGRLIAKALTQSRSSAEQVVDIEIGSAVAFLNSGAALNFVRVLQHFAGQDGLPIRIGVHMGLLGSTDGQPDSRGPLRLARQIAMRASAGEAYASGLFHTFVTQFDHRCKSVLRPLSPYVDAQAREVTLYAMDFEQMPPLDLGDGEAAGALAANDLIALPTEPEQRRDFLQQVERLLAEEIGPMAGILVRQAAETEKTRAAFFRQITRKLPEDAARSKLFSALGRL